MIACYDLARCPPTYDVVAFLALAEAERLRRGEDYIDVHILPGPADGFRFDSLWPWTVEGRVQMRDNVLLPLCKLLPSVNSVKIHVSYSDARKVVGWGVGEYFVGLPRIMGALRAGMRPLRPLLDMPKAKYITFTLREAIHHPLRNSHYKEWVAAARLLEGAGRKVIVVRDTARMDSLIAEVRTSYNAAASIYERAQLYAGADLNVGICNGPMWMSIFMDAPTLMLRPTTNEAGGCYDDAFYAQFGLSRGAQLPNSPPHQRLVWQEDTRENIVRAVEEMLVDACKCDVEHLCWVKPR